MSKKQEILEEVFKHGLINVGSKMNIKNKNDLSIAYTPGVGHTCLEIVKEPDLFYEYTMADDAVLVISNGSKFISSYLECRPSFILPLLEVSCLAHKCIANLSAFPVVFNSNIIPDSDSLLWLLTNISPVYNVIDIVEVDDSFINAIIPQLKQLNKVVVLPELRSSLNRQFEDTNDPFYLTQILLSISIKVLSRLHFWGVLDAASLDSLTPEIRQMYMSYKFHNEFEFKNSVLELVLSKFDSKHRLSFITFASELNVNYVSDEIQKEIFYHDFNPMNYNANSVFIHQKLRGMIQTVPSLQLNDLKSFLSRDNLIGVGRLCKKIFENPDLDIEYTVKRNYCAIVTNGTAILGLGNIGARAGAPVMEGKVCLFKQLGNVNVVPICLSTHTPEDTIRAVRALADTWNAINLEDIAAPDCFIIEESLIQQLHIPAFHDDQHGTAIVCLAGIINALKVANKNPDQVSLVINGAGAAGKAITDLLIYYKFKEIVVVDTKGAIYENRKDLEGNEFKTSLAQRTNRTIKKGSLTDVIKNTDVFIGVSVADVLTEQMVASMNKNPIIFALANPNPEIDPLLAKKGGALLVATGRSDYPNQINNSVVFPGVFRGIIDGKVTKVTMQMKIKMAVALAQTIPQNLLTTENILPFSLDPQCAQVISKTIQESFKQEP